MKSKAPMKKKIQKQEEEIEEVTQKVQVQKKQVIQVKQKQVTTLTNANVAKINDQKLLTQKLPAKKQSIKKEVAKPLPKKEQAPKKPVPLNNKPIVQPTKPVPPKPVIQQSLQQQSLQQPINLRPMVPVGGFYGTKPLDQYKVPQIYNDDEPIIERVKNVKQQQAKIQIEIRAQRTMIKLKEQTVLPAICSIKTSGGQRTNVDLICVIDKSGSMGGEKIQLVRDTMKFLTQTLTPGDRLCIITFDDSAVRVCGLKCCTAENMVSFHQKINSIQAGGGTTINSGLNIALQVMRERKHQNSVTSIFLLSDGQDRGAENVFKNTLQREQNKDLGVFSIHSFGFGNDHDEDLMTKICEIKDGSFYFIKELATLDQAFCNALGGIISVVASQMIIKVNTVAKNIVQGIKIIKTYGNMWEKINQRQYKIKLLQLMSGISKDYVFQIGIPAINTQVGDLDRNHDAIEGIYMAKGINGQNITGECCLKFILINQNQEIPDINENVDVIQNYLRMKATEAIQENMKKAENNQYQAAQQGIQKMINVIQGNKKARQEKMDSIVNDLKNIKQKCSKQEYQIEGKKWMKSAQVNHGKQVSYAYSNALQQEMVTKVKSKKMGN